MQRHPQHKGQKGKGKHDKKKSHPNANHWTQQATTTAGDEDAWGPDWPGQDNNPSKATEATSSSVATEAGAATNATTNTVSTMRTGTTSADADSTIATTTNAAAGPVVATGKFTLPYPSPTPPGGFGSKV